MLSDAPEQKSVIGSTPENQANPAFRRINNFLASIRNYNPELEQKIYNRLVSLYTKNGILQPDEAEKYILSMLQALEEKIDDNLENRRQLVSHNEQLIYDDNTSGYEPGTQIDGISDSTPETSQSHGTQIQSEKITNNLNDIMNAFLKIGESLHLHSLKGIIEPSKNLAEQSYQNIQEHQISGYYLMGLISSLREITQNIQVDLNQITPEATSTLHNINLLQREASNLLDLISNIYNELDNAYCGVGDNDYLSKLNLLLQDLAMLEYAMATVSKQMESNTMRNQQQPENDGQGIHENCITSNPEYPKIEEYDLYGNFLSDLGIRIQEADKNLQILINQKDVSLNTINTLIESLKEDFKKLASNGIIGWGEYANSFIPNIVQIDRLIQDINAKVLNLLSTHNGITTEIGNMLISEHASLVDSDEFKVARKRLEELIKLMK